LAYNQRSVARPSDKVNVSVETRLQFLDAKLRNLRIESESSEPPRNVVPTQANRFGAAHLQRLKRGARFSRVNMTFGIGGENDRMTG
jgi:hypothetical protein